MASISQVKTYGGIGAILTLLLPVPSIGWLLAIAGFVLTLIAVKYVSDIVKDQSIMNSMVVSILAAIVGVVVGFFIILGSFLQFVGLNNLIGPNYFGPNFNPATVPTGDWIGLITTAIVGFVVIWVALTVSGVYFRRGFSKVGSALNVGLFGTAGLLFLIGAATTIVLVGFILIPIALILLAIAFFSINENAPGLAYSGVAPAQGR